MERKGKVVSIYLPHDLILKLDGIAEYTGKTRAALCAEAVKEKYGYGGAASPPRKK
jgi:predicted DNA-binding protein